MMYNVGSPAYMAPEAFNENQYSEKSDVWALGIVLHEMLTGTIPIMRTTDVNEYFGYLRKLKTAEIIRGQQNELCTRLLLHALAVDTRLRYSTEELLNELRGLPATPLPSIPPVFHQFDSNTVITNNSNFEIIPPLPFHKTSLHNPIQSDGVGAQSVRCQNFS
jgi:serine/threonine protein kinase